MSWWISLNADRPRGPSPQATGFARLGRCARVAGGLLSWRYRAAVAAVLLTTMTGCLIPQDDHTLVIPPPPRNRPPRIITDQVTPVTRTLYLSDSATCTTKQQFQVYFADPDVDDTLYYRWYVDYTETRTGFLLEGRISTNGKEVRDDSAVLQANAADPASVFATPGPHLVEVIVSDGTLVDRTPQPRASTEPDAGDQETFVALWSWLVVTKTGSCGP